MGATCGMHASTVNLGNECANALPRFLPKCIIFGPTEDSILLCDIGFALQVGEFNAPRAVRRPDCDLHAAFLR